MAQNTVVFGLEKVHYAVITKDDGVTVEYAEPVHLPGAVSLEMESRSETSDFYADNIIYYTTSTNQGYEATLEMANVTDQFRMEVLGDILTDDNVLVENVSRPTKKIALLFQFEGDQNATKHCLTYCTVTRPGLSGATKTETTEPGTMELTLVASPRPDNNIPKLSCHDVNSQVYKDWYTKVPVVDLNAVAPIGTIRGANNATTLTLVYDKLLHVDGKRVADKADIKDNYSITGSGASITKAEYNEAAKTITLTIAGVQNASAVATTGLTGFNGVAVADRYTYAQEGTKWTKA